jgi:hypothetical protein
MSACSEMREVLEVAAVEPRGLDRIMAGDTPEAASAAGHLVACPPCAEELMRLERAVALLQPIVASMPSDELRQRILQRVRETGRERGSGPVVAPDVGERRVTPQSPLQLAAPQAPPASAVGAAGRVARRPRLSWLPAAVAAALVVGFAGGVALRSPASPGTQESYSGAFATVPGQQATLLAAPDARTVVLHDAAGEPRGSLISAQSLHRIVVMATGLADPGPGQGYRCWVESNGSRTMLGEMQLERDVAWWVGPASVPAETAGLRFGVTLTSMDSSSAGSLSNVPPVAVLTGP